jgi:mediator of RNA polymerase II transcription subunit 12
MARPLQIHDNPGGDVLSPLSSRLSALLVCLIQGCPESFISFRGWRATKIWLWDLAKEDDSIADVLDAIDLRNMRLEPSARFHHISWQQTMVTLLDTTLYSAMQSEMTERCWAIHSDGAAVATMVLDWCTSSHRPGITKLYIADKILQTWCHTKALDLTSLILDYIDHRGCNDGMGRCPKNDSPWFRDVDRFFYKLVSGFIQAGHFSASRYMQWLVARGGLLSATDVAFDGPYATRLLVELPECFLSSPVDTMRAGILGRAMFDSKEEQTDVAEALSLVDLVTGLPSLLLLPSRAWPSGMAHVMPDATQTCSGADLMPDVRAPLDKLCYRLRLGSRSLQIHVSSWIGRAVRAWVKTEAAHFPLDSFHAIRTILEAAVDYPVLADVVAALTSRADATFLVSCADTVSLHFDIFSALGRLDALFGGLREQLSNVEQEHNFNAAIRPALAALAAVAEQAYGSSQITTQLKCQLAELDRGSTCDACSPISEHLANLLQHHSHIRTEEDGDNRGDHGGQGHGHSHQYHGHGNHQLSPDSETDPMHDEIENLLTSRSSLDHLTMDQIFPLVIKRFEVSWAGTVHGSAKRPRAQHLALLRAFDPAYFDIRMSQWLSTVRSVASRRHLGDAFPLLITLGCIDISTVLDSALSPATTPPSQEPVSHSPPWSSSASLFGVGTYCQEILQFMVNPFATDSGLLFEEAGRFCAHKRRARDEHGASLLSLIRHAVIEYSAHFEQQSQLTSILPLSDSECQFGMLEMLRFLVPRDVGAAMRVLGDKGYDQSSSTLMSLIALRLLTSGPTVTPLVSNDGFWREATPIPCGHLLRFTNDLTRPFCQLKLHLDLVRAQVYDVAESTMGHRLRDLLDELSDAVHESAVPDCMEWANILPHIGDDMVQHFIARVEARLINLVPSPRSQVKLPMGHDKGNSKCSISGAQGVQCASGLLAVLESLAVTHRSPYPEFLQPPSTYHEESSLAVSIIDKLVDMWEILSSRNKCREALTTVVLAHWLPLVLRLVVIHFAPNHAHASTTILGEGSCSVANFTLPHAPPITTAPPSSSFLAPLTSPTTTTTAIHPTHPSWGDVRARMLLVLSALLQELEALHGAGNARLAVALAEHVFDIALLFSNDMTEDVRNTCVRLLRQQGSKDLQPVSSLSSASTSDRRLAYIFSHHRPSSSSEHLALARRNRNPTQTSVRRSAMNTNTASTIATKRGLGGSGGRSAVASTGIAASKKDPGINRTGRLVPFSLRLWEVLNEPTPNVGLNDTTLSLTLFDATKAA